MMSKKKKKKNIAGTSRCVRVRVRVCVSTLIIKQKYKNIHKT